MRRQDERVRLFENAMLERLSHVHPVTPFLLWTPLVVWLLWRSCAMHRLETGIVVALGGAGLMSGASPSMQCIASRSTSRPPYRGADACNSSFTAFITRIPTTRRAC